MVATPDYFFAVCVPLGRFAFTSNPILLGKIAFTFCPIVLGRFVSTCCPRDATGSERKSPWTLSFQLSREQESSLGDFPSTLVLVRGVKFWTSLQALRELFTVVYD